MRNYIGVIILAAIVVVALLAYMMTYTVGSSEVTLVTTFGKAYPDNVHDGRLPGQAGLKFKWPIPIEKLSRYDARIQQFDDPHGELNTKEKQTILLTTFCQWRIADVLKFQASVGSIDAAQVEIRKRLQSAETNVISQYNMEDLINVDRSRMKLDEIEQRITEQVRQLVEASYGVKVVMVGIKALGLPESTTEKVIEVMQAERQAEVNRYRSRGASQASVIRANARTAREAILAFARLKADNIRTEGYRQAAQRYRQYAEHPEFAMFLRSLESLRTELANQTVFLLDGSEIPAVKFFQEGPSLSTDTPDGP